MNIYIILGFLILIIFLIFFRILIGKIINKYNKKNCTLKTTRSRPPPIVVDYEVNDSNIRTKKYPICPNLDDYIHKSELIPNYTFSINPYYIKQTETCEDKANSSVHIQNINKKVIQNIINKKVEKKVEEKIKKTYCQSKSDMYEYDWVPVLDSECIV